MTAVICVVIPGLRVIGLSFFSYRVRIFFGGGFVFEKWESISMKS